MTSAIADGKYTITSITADTSVIVEFEAIPTYSLNIAVIGNGSVSYGGKTIRNQSQNFSLLEGESTTLSVNPDDGYRVKSLTIDGKESLGQLSGNQLAIDDIASNTNVEVTFEAIPPTLYTMTVKAIGNGSVIVYENQTVKNETSTFDVKDGSYLNIKFTPDEGYQIKSVKLDGYDVTDNVSLGYYIVAVSSDVTLEVEFEAIPPTEFTLTVTSQGYGAVVYDDTHVRGATSQFTILEGLTGVVSFVPDDGYKVESVIVNNEDVTASVRNYQYTINTISGNITIQVEFVGSITEVSYAGVNYVVTSFEDKSVRVAAGEYGRVLTIPSTFAAEGYDWKVIGTNEDAFDGSLAAIIWEPDLSFDGKVSNPNLLLYVKSAAYAPSSIKNVVVNNVAESITLTEAAEGNDFFCPKLFTAKQIRYEHNYSMKSGYNSCEGWETLVLPFDVSSILTQTGVDLVPHTAWTYGSNQRPFWLYSLSENGWKAETAIKANTPYLISMPNNEQYNAMYNVAGNITFVGSNVEVKASENLTDGKYGKRKLIPSYENKVTGNEVYALNVDNRWSVNTEAGYLPGSTFIRSLRPVHPFEAYLSVDDASASRSHIPVFEGGEVTGIVNALQYAGNSDDAIYNLHGQRIETPGKGLYIMNDKKLIKKW